MRSGASRHGRFRSGAPRNGASCQNFQIGGRRFLAFSSRKRFLELRLKTMETFFISDLRSCFKPHSIQTPNDLVKALASFFKGF